MKPMKFWSSAQPGQVLAFAGALALFLISTRSVSAELITVTLDPATLAMRSNTTGSFVVSMSSDGPINLFTYGLNFQAGIVSGQTFQLVPQITFTNVTPDSTGDYVFQGSPDFHSGAVPSDELQVSDFSSAGSGETLLATSTYQLVHVDFALAAGLVSGNYTIRIEPYDSSVTDGPFTGRVNGTVDNNIAYTSNSISISVTGVPEPGTVVLASAVGLLGWCQWWRSTRPGRRVG